jgi:hypothetical protein
MYVDGWTDGWRVNVRANVWQCRWADWQVKERKYHKISGPEVKADSSV